MKTWQVLLGATAIGLVVGFSVTAWEMYGKNELFFSKQYAELAAQNKLAQQREREHRPGQTWPKVQILGDADYDFGSMEKFSKKRHVFRIKNVGDDELTVEAGRTTCKCTISAVSGKGFKPGEVAEITVEWKGQTLSESPDFRQIVEIKTNDPDNKVIRLKLHGYVTETLRVLPEEIVVGQISSITGATAQFRLFGFRSDKIDVLETEFEDAEVADKYDVTFKPLPKEEVEKEKGASCGILGTLTLKPGLPLGPINQTIRVRAKADKEATVELPIRGRVESDIIIASSPHFEPRRNLLNFGALKRGESAKAVLYLYVKGPHRHETKFSVGSVDPEGYLHVDISPPEELNEGKTLRYAVTIAIPAGLEPINRLGSELAKYGRIVLETTHPQTKQVPIDVKFSVE